MLQTTELPPRTLFLADADVASLADWPSVVKALAEAYGKPVPDGMAAQSSKARGDGVWLRSLSAVSPSGGHIGNKLIAASPRARRVSYLISLFDQQTMALSALIDGNRVTCLRTAATAAIAVDLLAPASSLRIAVIGSGFQAQGALDCLRSIRTVEMARVYSPNPENRMRFAETFSSTFDVTASDDPEEAVRGADVVICAARSRDESPVLGGAWLSAGATVVSLGSTVPEQREVDEETMVRAACVVADSPHAVTHETGDAIAAARAGVLLASKVVSLAALVAGDVVPRRTAADIVLYKSVGSGLQDVVVAELLFARAKQLGRGFWLPVSIVPVAK